MSNCVKSVASCVGFFASPLSLDALNPRGNLHCQGRATPEKHLRTPPQDFSLPANLFPLDTEQAGWEPLGGKVLAGWILGPASEIPGPLLPRFKLPVGKQGERKPLLDFRRRRWPVRHVCNECWPHPSQFPVVPQPRGTAL